MRIRVHHAGTQQLQEGSGDAKLYQRQILARCTFSDQALPIHPLHDQKPTGAQVGFQVGYFQAWFRKSILELAALTAEQVTGTGVSLP